MDPSLDYLTEEREDQMVSPVPGERRGEATLRPAHFLTPTAPSGEFPVTDFPSETGFKLSKNGPKASNLKVNFHGWKHPPKDWKHWTDRMNSLHRSVWEKVGIFEAILSSCCKIHRCNDLIYRFVEKWRPETNTFVFPWGEATLTLEDVMMIGGYSVVGGPVFSSLECPELKEVELKLLSARSEIHSSKAKTASQGPWQQKFMDTGSEIEHEAFLAMWLSRFVFPRNTHQSVINKHVLPLAILLARGNKIALAPAVLAGIYSNLSDMKNALAYDGALEVSVSAPFKLLQIWIWERFLALRPSPVVCRHRQDHDEVIQTRFSRWDDLKFKAVVDVGSTIDESADCFLWRPYVIGCEKSFNDEARLVSVGCDIDEEVEMLVRCIRFSELVGIDSDRIEQYLPHRVSMQFGYDQDVPGLVARANCDQIMAWESYTRKVKDQRLYIPPQEFESDVTSRYAQWWKKNMPALSINPKKRRFLEGSSSKKAVNKVKGDKKKAGSTGSLLHKKRKPIMNCLDSKEEPSEKNLEKNDDKVQNRVRLSGSGNGIGDEPDNNVPDVTSRYAEEWKENMAALSVNPKKRRFLEGSSSKKAVSEVKRDEKKVGSTGSLHKKQKPITNRLDSKEEPSEKNLENSEKNDDRVQNRVRLSGSGNGLGNEPGENVPSSSNSKAASGNGSRRVYSIEEVEAMVANLEKTWAEVKARK